MYTLHTAAATADGVSFFFQGAQGLPFYYYDMMGSREKDPKRLLLIFTFRWMDMDDGTCLIEKAKEEFTGIFLLKIKKRSRLYISQ